MKKTLILIAIAFTIALVLFAALAMHVSCVHTRHSRQLSTKSSIIFLHQQLDRFYEDQERYPTQEEGIQALVSRERNNRVSTGPTIPDDAWGYPFEYQTRDGVPFIFSVGPDGKPGTRDDIDRNTEL